MTTPAKDTEMPSNGPEKAGVAAAAATTADLAAAPKGGDKTATTSQNKSQSDCDGPYICDCRLCICGGPVDYPGDLCYMCSKFH